MTTAWPPARSPSAPAPAGSPAMDVTQVIWAAAATVVTALWVVAALANGDPAPVDTTAMGAAAAAGAAAAVGAGWGLRATGPLWLAGLWLVVLPVGVAAGTRGSAPVLVVTLLVVAAAEVVAALLVASDQSPTDETLVVAGLVLLAASLVIAALVTGHDDDGRWLLRSDDDAASALGLAAAAVLLAAAALGPARGRALAAPALLVGLVVAPGLPEVTVAAVGGALAALSATVLGRRPGLAIGFLALAAAGFPAGRPAAALLAAGAALALALALALAYRADHPLAALLAVPGVASLTAELVITGGGTVVIVLAVATAVTVALVAMAATRQTPVLDLGDLPWGMVPAAVLGAWLLVFPGTWSWTGAQGLSIYDRGAAAAVAGGLIAVVARWAVVGREPA